MPLHRDAKGRWTTARITGTGKTGPHVHDAALLPGTRTLLGVGDLTKPGKRTADGAVFGYRN